MKFSALDRAATEHRRVQGVCNGEEDMSEPTICVNCKHHEEPEPHIFGGVHRCLVARESLNFVTGETHQPKPNCASKNYSGACSDYEPREAKP